MKKKKEVKRKVWVEKHADYGYYYDEKYSGLEAMKKEKKLYHLKSATLIYKI